MVLLKHQHLT